VLPRLQKLQPTDDNYGNDYYETLCDMRYV